MLAHMEEVNASSFSKSSLNQTELLLLVSGSLAHEQYELNSKPYLVGPAGRRTITCDNYAEQLRAAAVDT